MEIVVHGTKGGYDIFTTNKKTGLFDVNTDAPSASAIGQEAYAIRFFDKTLIFSKYRIIRDVRGGKRTGFIAFSLFLHEAKKLPGKEILSILNSVSSEYYRVYLPENDNNLQYVRENWDFLNPILKKHQPQDRLLDDIENLPAGSKDPAFIYYGDESQLIKLFDDPYQDEYSDYRQIYFVSGDLKGVSKNPLNALRHAGVDLTDKIDLTNKKYKLLFNEHGKDQYKISVTVNGKPRQSRTKIKRTDTLAIKWEKPYCDSTIKQGSLDDFTGEYLEINDTQVSIKQIELPDSSKTITLNCKDWKGKPLHSVTMYFMSGKEKIEVSNNRITFVGAQLGEQWKILAKKNGFLTEKAINFSYVDTSIDLVLNKLILELTLTEDIPGGGDLINSNDYKVSKTEFVGEEISRIHTIKVTSTKYEDISFSFCPEKENYKIAHTLKKRQSKSARNPNQSFSVVLGEHGSFKDGTDRMSYKENGEDVKSYIKVAAGWRLSGFQVSSDKLIAQYVQDNSSHNINKKIGIVIFIVVMFALVYKSWEYFQSGNGIGNPGVTALDSTDVKSIKDYIEGKDLELIKLIGFTKIDGIKTDPISKRLDSAIQKREWIDAWNIDSLKKVLFYPKQKKYADAILPLTPRQIESLKTKKIDISTFNLDEIADTITKEVGQSVNNGANATPVLPSAGASAPKTSGNTSPSGFNENIIKRADITRDSLNILEKQYPNVRSIKLYIEFWNLVDSPDQTFKNAYVNLKNKLNTNDILKGSELSMFLNQITASETEFGKFQNLPKGRIQSLKELIDKLSKK